MRDRPVVVFHFPCIDGFTAAWVARKYFQSIYEVEPIFLPSSHGSPLPDLEIFRDKDVYLLDFTYPLDFLHAIQSVALTVLVIDHHKTAEEDLANFPDEDKVFDMSKSGAVLTHEHLFPNIEVPIFLKYVQDRDLWTNSLYRSEAVHAWISSWPMDFDTWNFIDSEFRYRMSGIIQEGLALLRLVNREVERVCASARWVTIGGSRVMAANSPLHTSEVANRLADGQDFGACWHQAENGVFQYSLRSSKDGLDVSEIARQYGGGGHARAAGFRSKEILQ